MLSFFPRDVLDEILNLIESVSGGFPSYSFIIKMKALYCKRLNKALCCKRLNKEKRIKLSILVLEIREYV